MNAGTRGEGSDPTIGGRDEAGRHPAYRPAPASTPGPSDERRGVGGGPTETPPDGAPSIADSGEYTGLGSGRGQGGGYSAEFRRLTTTTATLTIRDDIGPRWTFQVEHEPWYARTAILSLLDGEEGQRPGAATMAMCDELYRQGYRLRAKAMRRGGPRFPKEIIAPRGGAS